MKRGFLLKAADKKKGLVDKPQPSKPKDTQISPPEPQLPTSRECVYRLRCGHLVLLYDLSI